MQDATLIYPHQLFDAHPAITQGRKIYLIEEPLLMGEFPIHAQKMLLHYLSIREYKKKLVSQGHDVEIIERTSVANTEEVFTYVHAQGITRIHVVDTVDQWLEKRIRESEKVHSFERVWYESPAFILSKEEAVERYVDSGRHMARFYKNIRIDKNILMSRTEPVGDKWSFDEDNRKKLPKEYEVPIDMEYIDRNEVRASREWLETLDCKTYGETKVWIPYTRESALQWLEDFLAERFVEFGPYEDAISDEFVRINHSVLSPLINCGLITPQEVLDAALEYSDKHDVPLNSVEGFVRQIIGWREFMRASYESDGTHMRNQNFFGHQKKLGSMWWTGETGIDPVDTSIKRSLQYGYVHHIERLMVLGNVMLLSGIHPDEAYLWFMSMYVDAYDWVMVPNVYGMSQFADGGSFATKPYIAGANYIKKMSNYKKGPWEETMTGLYWNFITTHYDVFKNNHRMSMMPRLLDKMDSEKRNNHLKNAQDFLNR